MIYQDVQLNPEVKEAIDTVVDAKLKYKASEGLSEEVVKYISEEKNEPKWMLEKRLQSLKIFNQLPMPNWGPNLSKLDLNKIIYYATPEAQKNARNWDDVPSEIKDTFQKLGIPEAEQKALAGAGAQFECISKDSLVFTNPKGPVKISEIQENDYVFSLDESTKTIKRAKVLRVQKTGKKKVYEIKARTKKLKVSDNHPFLSLEYTKDPKKQRGKFKTVWKPLKYLKKGDLVAIATKLPNNGKPYTLKEPIVETKVKSRNQFKAYVFDYTKSYNTVKFPQKTSKDLMWFLGLFLGDGYIKHEKRRSKARVNIAIPEEQKQLRDEVKTISKKLFSCDSISEYKYYISLNSSIIAKFLETNGFGGTAKTKSIPSWVYSISIEEKLSFLGGYLDADGHVRKNEKDVNFTSANRNMLEQIMYLSTYCGFNVSNIHKFKAGYKDFVGYRIGLNGNLSKLDSRYDFKKNRLKNNSQNYCFHSAGNTTFPSHCSEYFGFVKIDYIKEVGMEDVYDIEVEGHHNFVANGLVVHNSQSVYHSLKKEWEDKGVVFLDCDEGLEKYPDLYKKYFMNSCISPRLHKFAALHGAVWSGGTFLHIPKDVKVDFPLQAYFRMNAAKMGQFEHTLIIIEDGAQGHYLEGCSAPQYIENSLHAGCVEIFIGKNARFRYSSVENWSKNTYNLNTKRAVVDQNGIHEWVSGNMGSGVTMLYPCTVLKGENSRADHIAIAFAGKDQNQDTGAKIYHLAPRTTSVVTSKSISVDGGITSYRGLINIKKGAKNAKTSVQCDALIMGKGSKSNTFPYMKINENKVDIAHEATVGKISEDKIFYLMSRGLSQEQATSMIVSGFIEPVVKELTLEYAVELNRLIQLEMEGSVG